MELLSSMPLVALGALIGLGLGWYAWRNRILPVTAPFAAVLFLGLFWIAADTLELAVPTLQDKLVCLNLGYLAYAFLPLAWLALVLEYAGHRFWRKIPLLAPLGLIPAATQILTWTNGHHHLLRTAEWLKTAGPYQVVNYAHGPWYWVYAIYGYVLLAVATAILLASIFTAPRLHWRQPIALLVASLLPLVLEAARTWGPYTAYAHSLTPAVLGTAGVLAASALFRVRVFRLGPIARHALVENLSEGVLVLDETDRVVDLNRAAQRLIGRPVHEVLSRPLAEVWEVWRQISAFQENGATKAQVGLVEHGDERHYEVEWTPVWRRNRLAGHLVVARDVTDRALMEHNLRQQAFTDTLTGLPNRAFFMTKVDESIRRARRYPEAGFAVLVLDLDRFKTINDSIGHLAGDVLLQSVAAKLRSCVREVDTVARMGGDEFMIILDSVSTTQEVVPILERIREELETPVFFRQQEMVTTCSIGVVVWDPSYSDPEDLLRAADIAMYQAKEAGRNCYRIFDEEMHQAALRALEAETDLRTAVKNKELAVVYQPIVDLRTGTVCALEALARWEHAKRGLILPEEFISVAENCGLIVPLGTLILDRVCSQMSEWREKGVTTGRLPVSLNVSPRQLTESDFLSSLAERLAVWHIPAEQLVLEITESVFVKDPKGSLEVMHELRRLGISLCLDDFGTGASSLQHLITFPVQELKIDQTLTSKVRRGSVDYAVVRSLIDLAHTLGLTVTAEGIEEPEQWALLAEMGCDHGQGYYFGRPMGAADLLRGLGKNQDRSNLRVLRRYADATLGVPRPR